MDMVYETFVRKPFLVEAVEVTEENLEEIAKLVGELRTKDGKPFIQVNRNVVPGVVRVHPGYMMTRFGDNLRCYNKRVFASQFAPNTPAIEEWVNFINTKAEEPQEAVQGAVAEPEEAVAVEEVPQPDSETVPSG